MQTLYRLIVAGLVATAGPAALLSMTAVSAQEPAQHGFARGTESYEYRMDQYHEAIAHMSPENRSKLMAMQDHIMQMEMDRKTSMAKMDMEMAKAKRDMEMFVASFIPFQDPRNAGH